MSALVALAGASLALLPAPGAPGDGQDPVARRVPAFSAGIQVNEPDPDAWAASLSRAGLDAVQVTLYARQQAWDGPDLWFEREAPWVLAEIRAAKRRGLRVILVMRVALEHGLAQNRHLWHGMIWPRQEALEAWESAYRDFVLWGAGIASREGVDLFAVGNELSSLTSTRKLQVLPELYAYLLDPVRVEQVREQLVKCADAVREAGSGVDLVQLDGGRYASLDEMLQAEDLVRRRWVNTVMAGDPADLGPLNDRRARYERYWRRLLAQVREAYAGPLTYGANFDQVQEVGFWDALDAVGVNAYFPLNRYGLAPEAQLARMHESWRGVSERLERAAAGRPVVLLELGWTRRLGATVRPYSYSRVEVLETGPVDPPPLSCVHWATQPFDAGERVRALEALRDVIAAGDFPALRGFTLWKLTTRPEHRSIEPFSVVLPPGQTTVPGDGTSGSSDEDELDRDFLELAADLARALRQRVAGVEAAVRQ